MQEEIRLQARQALEELIEVSGIRAGELLVVGCSSSEVMGERIGKGSSMEAAQAVFAGISPLLRERGIYLAAQCCEHLNRALILETEAADKFGYEIVNVRPWAHAGGSFATTVWENLEHPAAVEHIRAKAGMDIGDTLIGMHLKEVGGAGCALASRASAGAHLVCARTRPRFIGGGEGPVSGGTK